MLTLAFIRQVSLVVFLSFGLNVPRLFLYEYDTPSFEFFNSTDYDDRTSSSSSHRTRHFSDLGQDRVFEVSGF